MPLVSRTRATLRSAEFGFLGVVVYTRVHTPRRWGLPLSAGVLVLPSLSSRPLRTSCWIVGTASPRTVCGAGLVLLCCVRCYCSGGALRAGLADTSDDPRAGGCRYPDPSLPSRPPGRGPSRYHPGGAGAVSRPARRAGLHQARGTARVNQGTYHEANWVLAGTSTRRAWPVLHAR